MTIKKTSSIVGLRSSRAGVIPFTIHKGTMMFCLGIDKRSGDYTDFGGGSKEREDAIMAAIREFKEESGHFVPTKAPDLLKHAMRHSFAAYTRDQTVLFVPFLDRSIGAMNHGFASKTTYEMSAIEWLTIEQFEQVLAGTSDRPMYHRVKRALDTISFSNFAFVVDAMTRHLQVKT